MLSKLREKKRLWKRALFGSFAATSVMFTFCACYGMPSEQFMLDNVSGTVVDAETGNPVPGVQVQSTSLGIDVVTGNDGSFIDSTSRILESWSEFDFSVRDIDGAENGEYENLDTFLFAHNLDAPLHLQVKPKHDDR